MGRKSTINPSLTFYGPYLTLGRVGTTKDGYPLILCKNVEKDGQPLVTLPTHYLHNYTVPRNRQKRVPSEVQEKAVYGDWRVIAYLMTDDYRHRTYEVECIHCGFRKTQVSGRILDRMDHGTCSKKNQEVAR